MKEEDLERGLPVLEEALRRHPRWKRRLFDETDHFEPA